MPGSKSRSFIALPSLCLLLGLAAAVWFGLQQDARNKAEVAQRLMQLADRAAADLSARFRTYQFGLRGARGAVVAGGGSDVSRRTFRQYVESRDLDVEFPGARGFGFIARVPRSREQAFVSATRADGAPGFALRLLAPHEGERFVIRYLEPAATNEAAIGLDIASEPNRRSAALASMASGAPTLTGPITLVQASGQPQRSMLFLLPVYRGMQQVPAARRDRECIGWVVAPLVTDEILADFALANVEYGFSLTDVGSGVRFFASGQDVETDALRQSREFELFGRRWRVDIDANPEFVTGLNLPDPLRVGASVASSALLVALALYFALLAGSRKRRSEAQRARLAAIVESSHDAVIGTTLDGRVTEWNRAATEMFGYRADEALGRTKLELIVPREHAREDLRLLEQGASGRAVDVLETVRRSRDGTLRAVELSSSPIKDRRGTVTGVAVSLRDITDRKAAQAEVLALTTNLEHQVEERTAQLQAFSALQRAILANAGYAIIATDREGTITLFNPAAEAMLGYRSEDLVGVASLEKFHDALEVAERAFVLEKELGRPIAPGFEAFIAKAAVEPDVNEWTFVTRSGDRIPVLLNVSALRGSDAGITGYLGIAVDLRERKRREAALEINERKLRGLFELSPLGIALIDDQGRLLDCNEAFCTLTGYSLDELRALDYWSLTPPEYKAQEKTLKGVLMRTGRFGPYEKDFLRKDNTRVPARFNGLLLPIEGSLSIWTIAEDISLQRTAEAAMVDAVAAAEAASKAKGDFLANMSHEIRTPMNAILGMLQLLRRTPLDQRQSDYASKTETAAKTLLAILNDILDFSKVEAGRQTLESHDFRIDELLRDIAVILSTNVGDKDIELVFDIDEKLPAHLLGDSLRLQQVLINLAGNAVKFTHVGEVVLSVRRVAQTADRLTLRFEVRDTGIGIDERKLESIFEGFSQAEASTTRRFGGTGLGLAISQRLVRLMGGELAVESERGRGSRFHFTIGFALPEGELEQSSVASTEGSGTLRAMVVDDNASARAAIVDMVRSLGWHADGVASGQEALDRLEDGGADYDVVFLDWRMPGLDGWETSQRIRRMSDKPSAPLIIMVTAHGREILAERSAREASVLDGFLVKPVTVSMLMDAVADARAGYDAGMTGTTQPREPKPERLRGLRVLAVDDNVNNQQVVTELLQDEGAEVVVAGGGMDALGLLTGDRRRFDVVLMDIQMPDMDGYTVTRRIRTSLALKSLPIIAMTANVLPSDRDACLEAGMNDHIGKPFDLDALVARLQHWTGRSEAPATEGGSAASSPATSAPVTSKARAPALLDAETALARFGGNRGVYAAALERFVDSTNAMVDDIERLLRTGQREDAGRQLHTLKGIAGTVGADRLARTASTMEAAVRAGGATQSDGLVPLRRDTTTAIAAAGAAHEELQATLSATPTEPARTNGAPSIPADTLERLASLLAASNMRALDVFADIGPALAVQDAGAHAAMTSALDNLDFVAARAACARFVPDGGSANE